MASITAVWLAPPDYAPDKGVPARPGGARQRVPGAVLGLLARGEAVTPAEVERVLAPFWGRVWAARVLLHPPDAAVASAVMAYLGVDLVLSYPEMRPEPLRAALTAAEGLGWPVVDRLRLHGCTVDGVCEAVIHAIVDGAPEQDLQTLLQQAGVRGRTARSRLLRARLPGPGAWRTFARVLRPVLALQGRRAGSIERAAGDYGFGDRPNLEHVCHRRLGCTAGEAAAELGWQPLLGRFLAKHAR
jgi:hypothetical protein